MIKINSIYEEHYPNHEFYYYKTYLYSMKVYDDFVIREFDDDFRQISEYKKFLINSSLYD